MVLGPKSSSDGVGVAFFFIVLTRIAGEVLPLNVTGSVKSMILREQLRRAAEVSGRSISEEIEYRLDQSFRDEYMAETAIKAMAKYFEEKEVARELTSKKIEEDKS